MAGEERAIYLKGGWNTRQARDASYELARSNGKVLNQLVPIVEELTPYEDPIDGTDAIRDAFHVSRVPGNIRRIWARSELLVYQFLTSLSTLNTPRRLDQGMADQLVEIEHFVSLPDALSFFEDTGKRITSLVSSLERGKSSAIILAGETYFESRALRLAATQGRYLAKLERVTPVAI